MTADEARSLYDKMADGAKSDVRLRLYHLLRDNPSWGRGQAFIKAVTDELRNKPLPMPLPWKRYG